MNITDIHIIAFIDYLKFEKRYSQHTLLAYKKDLSQFTDYLQTTYETLEWNTVSSLMLRSWMAALKNEANDSNKTIHRKISAVKSFYKYLLRQKVAAQSPAEAIILPKIQKRLPEFLKEKEVMQLMTHDIKAAERSTEEEELSPEKQWRRRTEMLAIEVFYATGIRLSELVNLKESQIDASYCQLKVLGKGRKERIIPLSEKLLSQIKDYISKKPTHVEDILFVSEKGKKLYPKFFYTAVNRHMKCSDIKVNKKSPHVLRHTFATHLMNKGADINAVKELLGHSSLAATQVYTHNTIEKLKEVYKNAHPKA